MRQPGGGAGFLMESLHHSAVVRQIGPQDLERDLAIHPDLDGTIDGAHSAFTEPRHDCKALDSAAQQWIVVGVRELGGIDQDGSVMRTELLTDGLARALTCRTYARLRFDRVCRRT